MNYSVESPICVLDSSEISINIINPQSIKYTIEITDGITNFFLLVDSLGNDFNNGNPIKFKPEITTSYTILSITDDNGCNSVVNQLESIIVNQLPILTLDIPHFYTQDSSRTLNYGSPNGGYYYINGEPTNFFDIENLEEETYQIEYHYNDPITSCYNAIYSSVQINSSPLQNLNMDLFL